MTALSYEPRTGAAAAAPADSTAAQVESITAAAVAVAPAVADASPSERAAWLDAIAGRLRAHAGELCDIADLETALGAGRLTGELDRAATGLQFYGAVGREGSWLDATIDTATNNTATNNTASQARPDLRRVNRPVGPVAVFGASNFPFGFGVLGHDTGSALAAGCPVVVKAHPAHPRLSRALADVAAGALRAAGAPERAVQIVFGYDAGTRIVTDHGVRAVAFTGSEAGGMALWRLAATRPEPVPVFAEMGTINTAVVTRAGARERLDEIATGFVDSFTLGMGQFCTKPGLLLAPAGAGLPDRVGAALQAADPRGWMLTQAIATSYAGGLEQLVAAGATVLAQTPAATAGWAARPAVLLVRPELLRPGSRLLAECFGPVALVAEYADDGELDMILSALPGSLAAAVHGALADDADVAALVGRLAGHAGRVVVDGWPTGVAVTWAQQHGGPWPATTVPAASSVGAAALRRFVRPVAYQNVPDAALPIALQRANPWRVPRRLDGSIPNGATR